MPGKHLPLLLALLFFVGCQTRTKCFFPVDRSASGWQTRTGQAIWKPDREKPEIVGDLVISWNHGGNAYLEFSKGFPIVNAHLMPDAWNIEFPPQNKSYGARGAPPSRISWLQLLRAWTGGEVAKAWRISERTETTITLSNAKTGELIEAHF